MTGHPGRLSNSCTPASSPPNNAPHGGVSPQGRRNGAYSEERSSTNWAQPVAAPPENMPRVTPDVFYDDLRAALDWLSKAFGFETRSSMAGPDGKIMHSEMQIEDGVIIMGPASGNDAWTTPKALSGAVTQSLYVYVDDVDGDEKRSGDPHERAKSLQRI